MIRDVYGISSPKWELLMAAYHNVRHQIDKPWLFIGVVFPPVCKLGVILSWAWPEDHEPTLFNSSQAPTRIGSISTSTSLEISTPKVWNFISPHLEMFCLKICSWHPITKQKKQHRHVNSWSSFSPWFSPCFPMVFPFVHHFSPQKSGGFWDPTWTSKSRCQA